MDNTETTVETNAILKVWFWRLWPTFNLGEGLLLITQDSVFSEVVGTKPNSFEWDNVGRSLVLLSLQSVALMMLVFVLESHAQTNGALVAKARTWVRRAAHRTRALLCPSSVVQDDDGSDPRVHGVRLRDVELTVQSTS